MKDSAIPFFKFEPAAWLTGSIRNYSLEHQAMFLAAASLIWRDSGFYKF